MRFFTLILISCISLDGTSQKAYFTQNIDSLIMSYITENDFPSAAVGVVYQDKVWYAQRITKEKVINEHSQSIYNIASVAKPFVATAILQLVQEGQLDLQSPVINYLPDFRLDSKYTDNITLKHLLTHTSGLPNTSSVDDYNYNKVDTTNQALANHINSLSSLKLLFKPGKKYAYSNVGFEVLGQILATVSGVSFEEYMTTHLFTKLQMDKTSYLLTDFTKEEIAQPHANHPYKITDRFPYNRAFSPSGNLFTSIEDLNKWMIFNLNNGRYKDFEPLSQELFQSLTIPRVETQEGDSIGLSWFVMDQLVFHDGLDLGYTALMMLYQKQKFGITVLINHQEANCNELLNAIAKSISF